MSIRKLLSIGLACIALAVAAEDPAVGTWKLNPTKSTFSPEISKEAVAQIQQPTTLVITRENDHMEVTILRGAIRQKYWYPAAGGPMAITEGQALGAGEAGTATVSSGRKTALFVFTKDGKEVGRTENVIGSDRKTLTSTEKGTGPDGKPYTIVQVFERE